MRFLPRIIKTVKDSKLFGEIYVSSDDNLILDMAAEFGAKPLRRPDYLATYEADFEDVIEFYIKAFNVVESHLSLCVIAATAHALRVEHLKESAFIKAVTDRHVISVPHYNDPIIDACHFYWIEPTMFLGNRSVKLLYQPNEDHPLVFQYPIYGAVDIDTPEDMQEALAREQEVMP